MQSLILFLTILGAGVLAQPASSSFPNHRRGTHRTGHTAWIASYAPNDHDCRGPWLNGTDGDSDQTRPTLTWTWDFNAIMKNFTTLDGTDNVGIYFGTHQNQVNWVYFYHVDGVQVNQISPNGKGPGACISASAFGYPWTGVEGSS